MVRHFADTNLCAVVPLKRLENVLHKFDEQKGQKGQKSQEKLLHESLDFVQAQVLWVICTNAVFHSLFENKLPITTSHSRQTHSSQKRKEKKNILQNSIKSN